MEKKQKTHFHYIPLQYTSLLHLHTTAFRFSTDQSSEVGSLFLCMLGFEKLVFWFIVTPSETQFPHNYNLNVKNKTKQKTINMALILDFVKLLFIR